MYCLGVERHRPQRHGHDQEDEREGGQHQRQRDLVRRALADARLRPGRSSGRGTIRPAPAVMRTTMRSDSTRVPPVTPERSPPASRITGADSPVIADSSTEATPSMISPSPGMIWPASTTTRSPGLSSVEDTCFDRLFGAQPEGGRVVARLAQRLGLRLAARLGQRRGEIGEQHRQEQPDVERDQIADRTGAGRQAERRLNDVEQASGPRRPRPRTSPGSSTGCPAAA